jgi:hypothetical protein
MLTLLRIKRSLLLGKLVTAFCLLMTSNVYATPNSMSNSAQLEVTPKRCIALRKGQKCYLEVTFQWQHPQVSDYCLVNKTTNKNLKCWTNQSTGSFNLDFQSTKSNDFTLRNQNSITDLANVRIDVAWVYKSSKRAKSTWRLF